VTPEPGSPLPPYAARLARIREAIAAADVHALLVTHPPNVRYLTGFDGSMGALLVARDLCTLFVDGRYLTTAHALISRLPELSPVSVALVEGGHEEAIAGSIPADRGVERIGIEAAAMTVSRFERLISAMRDTHSASGRAVPRLVPLERIVEEGRLVKDQTEISTLREAARRLSAVARDILPLAQAGRREREIAADIDAALRRAGFERPAFDTIVASGPNSALPHARPGDRRLHPGDGVVLDFGGVYDGYCVDLTRTVQLPPRTGAFGHLLDAVGAAHDAAIAAVAPGVPGSAVDAAAREVLEARGLGEAFVHGTGHGLGLEVHEEPRISRTGARRGDVLRPGMVFTIEPGAYIPGLGGVRLEDDVLVDAGGCEVLTDVPIEQASAVPGGARQDG